MANSAQASYNEVPYMPEPFELLKYLQQTVEADEKLLELAEESVRCSEQAILVHQNEYYAWLSDIHAYQQLIQHAIDQILAVSKEYEEVPQELQQCLTGMEQMLDDVQRAGQEMQEIHTQAGAGLLEMKGCIEMFRMKQEENVRNEREKRREPCFVGILRALLARV